MPMLKKRSGKLTITLYADEQRDIEGTIEVMGFLKNNCSEPVRAKCGELLSGLQAVLQMMTSKQATPELEKPF